MSLGDKKFEISVPNRELTNNEIMEIMFTVEKIVKALVVQILSVGEDHNDRGHYNALAAPILRAILTAGAAASEAANAIKQVEGGGRIAMPSMVPPPGVGRA